MHDKPRKFLTVEATPALIALLDKAVLERQAGALRGPLTRSALVREAVIEYLNKTVAPVARNYRKDGTHG